jgi:general secretion pathway protein G
MPTGRPRGFTLIELLVVMALIALLAGLVSPLVSRSIQRAKEATLAGNLAVTRKAIDDYYADHGASPPHLDALVEGRYLRAVPLDPVTGQRDSWTLVQQQAPEAGAAPGIIDLHSGSTARSLRGEPYSRW